MRSEMKQFRSMWQLPYSVAPPQFLAVIMPAKASIASRTADLCSFLAAVMCKAAGYPQKIGVAIMGAG